MNRKLIFHPIISNVQKIALYETKTKFYLVGSNATQNKLRLLQIDRTHPRDLLIYDDKKEYSKSEIQTLLLNIDQKQRIRPSSGNKTVSAFGIVGFVRFLEGYYVILVTKRTRVGVIGFHSLYKIEDTCMIYIPSESVRVIHPDEQRYVKMFQNIDLSSNFYFSYSYDLTHTLQYNLATPKNIIPHGACFSSDHLVDPNPEAIPVEVDIKNNTGTAFLGYSIRNKPHRKFVWNDYLLSLVEGLLHPDWLIYITHGFIGRFSSFVQMRGSVPSHWSQDMTRMVAKPAITIDLYDPYGETTGIHLNELLMRYGAPIVILNLVKKREKKKHESILSNELATAVAYLNQFLPTEFHIDYVTFDMARMNKGKEATVLEKLASIANKNVRKTGIFVNQVPFAAQRDDTIIGRRVNGAILQTGIIRTNCVDCLDRTNTAQFAIGKCALGFQLCALGLLDHAHLEFDSDCVRMLEGLYEDHGDTLALQYGGSQLVHRIKTYRKTAPWTSQGNDIMQTLSRYYSNTFSDAEKQNTINLFLGLYVPLENELPIWEQISDFYLHNPQAITYVSNFRRPKTQWWDVPVLKSLPFSLLETSKTCSEVIEIHNKNIEMIDAFIDYHRSNELSIISDIYAYKIINSIRDFMPSFTVNYSPFVIRVRPGRRYEAAGVSSKGGIEVMKNPSLTGQSSTSSAASDSDVSTDSSSENESASYVMVSRAQPQTEVINKKVFNNNRKLFHCSRTKDVYGFSLATPKKSDLALYSKYVFIGKRMTLNSHLPSAIISKQLKVFQSHMSHNDTLQVDVPVVSERSKSSYYDYTKRNKYVSDRKNGAEPLLVRKYKSYVNDFIISAS